MTEIMRYSSHSTGNREQRKKLQRKISGDDLIRKGTRTIDINTICHTTIIIMRFFRMQSLYSNQYTFIFYENENKLILDIVTSKLNVIGAL